MSHRKKNRERLLEGMKGALHKDGYDGHRSRECQRLEAEGLAGQVEGTVWAVRA